MIKGLGFPELIIVLVVIVIFFGLGKLPQVGGQIGKAIRNFQKARTGEVEEDPAITSAVKKVSLEKQNN